ncbi:hypothetical protein H8D85_02320, partial [bacterium]|nr:hypothetical protein [bacterium]
VEKKALERDKERLRATEKEIAELKLGYEKTISDSKAIHFSNKVYQVSGEDYTMMEVHDKLTNINTEVSRLDVKLGAATKKIKEFNKLNTESRIVTDKINADYETKAEELNKEYKEAANSAKTQEELDWVNSYYKNRHNILHSESVALFQEEIDKNKDVKSGYANYKKLLDERNSLAQQYESFTNTGIIEDTKEVSGLYDGWEGKMKAHNEEFSDVTAANLRKKKEQEKKKRGEEDFIRKYTTEGGLGVYTAGKRFLGGFIEAVPGLMQAATAGGYYGAFENFSDVLYEEAHNEFMTQSSKYNRGLVEDIARLEDGNEIVFDHKGQAIAVYGKDGYILSEKEQKQIIDEDKIARKKGEAPEISKGETNERILFNKFASTTGDMIGLIYGGSKFTKGVKALGVGSKAAQFTGLTISGFVAQTDDLFNEAVMSGMSRGNASKFALTTGVVLGALENISPNEAIWKGTAKKMAIKKALGFFKEKGVVGAGKHVTREFVKGLADENIQEISQTLAEKGIKYMTNQSMDENFFDTEVTMNEIKETAILTTMSTGTLQGRTAYQQIKNPSLIRQNALYNIMEEGKADDFIAQAKEKVETGEWTVEEGDIAIRTLNSAQLAWQDIPKKGNLSDRQKSALVYKMTQKYELEHDKSSNPLLNEMYDINMEMVDNDIKKIISGEYFEAKEGAQSVGYEMAEFVMKSKEDGGLGMTMDEFKAIQKKAEKEGVEKLDKDEKEVMTKYNKQLLDTTTREDTRFENMAKQNLKEQGIETPSSEQIYKEKQKVIKAENALYKSVISEAQEDKRTETELAKAKEEGREGIKGSTTITSKNLEEVDNLESQAITTSQKKALQQVKGVLGALKNIAPDIDIQIHATSQDMIDAAQSPNVEGNESGLFIDEDGSIHINMEKVRENTVAHEGVHPIIDAIKKHNPELHKQIESDLMKHIKETPELAKYLEFGEAYRKTKEEIEKDGKELGYTGDKLTEYVNEQIAENKETIPDETIVEFLADVASGKVKLPPKAKKSLWEKLKSLIKKYSSNYNLTEEEIDKMSFEKTLDVAQSIVGAVQTGQAFSLDSTTEAPKTSEKTESKKESKDKKDKKQIIGENAYLSKNVREGLLIAKIMHKHASLNTDKKAIKLKTGWEQGLDGKWRYEILDGKFKETVNFHGTKQKLSEVLYSPELFKAYPSMKDIEVILNVSVHGAERSWYKPEDRSIEINAKSKNAAFINLIHEIQHDIQFIEGFSKGGNDMSAMDGFLNNITPEIQAEWDNLLLKKKILGDITYLLENPMVVDLPPSEVFTNKFMNENKDVDGMLSVSPEDILDYLDKNPEFKKDLFIESTLEESFDVADIKRSEIIEELSFRFSPYSLYQRLSGEVEARNVENRSWMSIESKRKSLFQNTEDVAREDQILLDASELSKAPEAMKPVIEKSIRESFELGFITRLEQAEQLDELKLASPTEALKKDKKQVTKSTPMNFKTVDEFIKAQGTPVYHGGNAEV